MSTRYSLNAYARAAGFLYLVLIICGPFSMMYVPSVLIVTNDAAATAANIADSEWLFRLGLAGDAIIFLTEIVLTVVLYFLFRPVSETISLAAAFSRLAMAMIQGTNVLLGLTALVVLGNADYLAVFEADQLSALGFIFIEARLLGVQVWGAFFGLHLALLGYLLYRAGYFPRLLGVLVMTAGLGYLINSFGTFLAVDYGTAVAAVVGATIVVGELSFVFWLWFKGVNAARENSAIDPGRR